jgi:hypothetical protein
MAILHEKELVLNKQDTENFLLAADTLRSIVKLIDMNSLHSQISQLSSASMFAAGGNVLE